ncbi:MAG: cation:proton antiporter, partial [Actinomycetota bacterium]
IFPFALGFGLILLLGHSSIEAMFVGTAMSATSIGITARVLSELNLLARKYSRVILGAAVLDDILALLLLVAVSGLGRGSLSLVNLALIVVEVLAFLFITLFVVRRIAKRRAASILKRLNISNAPFAVAIVVSLGLSALSSYIGMAAIIGAFLAGVIFAETEDKFVLQREIAPVYAFLVPFFFVVMGTKVDIKQFVNPTVVWLMLAVILLAIIGKLFGGFLGSTILGWRSALNVGIGMIPRGEVGLIVASIGLGLGKVPLNMYSIVVSMSVITTLIVPPILKLTTKD